MSLNFFLSSACSPGVGVAAEKKFRADANVLIVAVEFVPLCCTIALNDMAKVLLSDNSSESSDSEAGGADIGENFKVNQKYAEKFEYNKKREERAKREYNAL